MVHNGIEYGLMQGYAEGFDIMKGKDSEGLPKAERYSLDLADIAEVWRRGSVEEAVPANVLSAALFARFGSREEHSLGERLQSVMRFGFGGRREPMAGE